MMTMISRFLRNNIYLVPPIMMGATFLSHIIELNYVIAGNILGYSVLASLPMIYIFWFTKRYCWFTKLSVIALPIMNIVCIVGAFLDYQDYSYIYDLTIISLTVFASIILTIQKK